MRHQVHRAPFRGGIVVVGLALTAGCGSAVPSSATQPPPAATPAVAAATPIPTPSDRATAVPTPAATVAPSPAPSGVWTVTASSAGFDTYARSATATILKDGRVLLVDEGMAPQLYDPTTGHWTTTGRLHAARRRHTAALLADGRVLVAGGWEPGFTALTAAEVFDPATGSWSETAPMVRIRSSPKSVTLPDGRVLVMGGNGSGRGIELFQPATGRWRGIPGMTAPPGLVVQLQDGRVLVTHGDLPAEIFDPVRDSWTPIASPGTSWGHPGAFFDQAVALPNGAVLLLDGEDGLAESYDPTAGTWARVDGAQTGRGLASTLTDGSVVMVGVMSSARRDPNTGAWTSIPRPPLRRDYGLPSADGIDLAFLVRLVDGRLLASEGGSTALFDPNGAGG